MIKITDNRPMSLMRQIWLIVVLLMAVSANGCFEPESGCLDVLATNFDVSADEPCPDDCCTYPSLQLAFLHIIIPPDNPDTFFTFRYNEFYGTNDGDPGDTFTIERIRYMVSNLKLIKTDGEKIALTDSLSIEVNGTSTRVEENFTRADRDIFQTSTMGNFIDEGTIDSITFTIGLPEEILAAATNSIAAGSALDIFTDTLLFDAGLGYVPIYLAFNKDTISTTDSTIVKIYDPIDIGLKIDTPFSLNTGFDVKVTLQVDYLSWFKDINLPEQGDPSDVGVITPLIVENIANSFTLFEIE